MPFLSNSHSEVLGLEPLKQDINKTCWSNVLGWKNLDTHYREISLLKDQHELPYWYSRSWFMLVSDNKSDNAFYQKNPYGYKRRTLKAMPLFV